MNSKRINGELVTWYNSSQTCPYTLQTAAQPDCCATKFKPAWKLSNCCTNRKPHHTRSNSLCSSLCCANRLTVWGALRLCDISEWQWSQERDLYLTNYIKALKEENLNILFHLSWLVTVILKLKYILFAVLFCIWHHAVCLVILMFFQNVNFMQKST